LDPDSGFDDSFDPGVVDVLSADGVDDGDPPFERESVR
jgi:hypothetical protein